MHVKCNLGLLCWHYLALLRMEVELLATRVGECILPGVTVALQALANVVNWIARFGRLFGMTGWG